jgi:hypothetical protein
MCEKAVSGAGKSEERKYVRKQDLRSLYSDGLLRWDLMPADRLDSNPGCKFLLPSSLASSE